jgi:hypothetical protein
MSRIKKPPVLSVGRQATRQAYVPEPPGAQFPASGIAGTIEQPT